VVVLAIACSTNARTTSPERVKDAIPSMKESPDATPLASIDAMSEGPSEDEIEEALARLSSEHGSQDIRDKDWWLKNGQYVRQRLRDMIEDDQKNNTSDKWAVRILGDIGDPGDVELLAKVLTTFEYETVRHAAAFALGAHRATEATAALLAATNDKNEDTVAWAATGLGMRKSDEAARTRLEALVDHASSNVRYHAVDALAEMGGSKQVLEKRRKIEKDADVRQALAKALKKK
jgi:HEAT repeat protein